MTMNREKNGLAVTTNWCLIWLFNKISNCFLTLLCGLFYHKHLNLQIEAKLGKIWCVEARTDVTEDKSFHFSWKRWANLSQAVPRKHFVEEVKLTVVDLDVNYATQALSSLMFTLYWAVRCNIKGIFLNFGHMASFSTFPFLFQFITAIFNLLLVVQNVDSLLFCH